MLKNDKLGFSYDVMESHNEVSDCNVNRVKDVANDIVFAVLFTINDACLMTSDLIRMIYVSCSG